MGAQEERSTPAVNPGGSAAGGIEGVDAAEIDPDLEPPARRDLPLRDQWQAVGVVALGGMIGASARYGAALLWPVAPGHFPWTTLGVNALGCAVIGVFMVMITEVWAPHRLVRPFFGTGVLGGFTTFSTYAVDLREQLGHGHPAAAAAYLLVSLVGGILAVALGLRATSAVLTRS